MKNLNKVIIAGLLVSSAITSANAAAAKSSDFALKARVGANVFRVKEDSLSGISAGYAGEIAADYFFTPNFAIEGAVGYSKFKGNSKNISYVPLTVTGLYYFAPESGFSPYAGLGYSYKMSFSKIGALKIKNGGGLVAQLGSDFKINDTMSINADVKYTHDASHTITDGDSKAKVKFSTVTAMVGVAFPM